MRTCSVAGMRCFQFEEIGRRSCVKLAEQRGNVTEKRRKTCSLHAFWEMSHIAHRLRVQAEVTAELYPVSLR